MSSLKTKNIALSALFTAVTAATAWISIPTPFGINLAFTLFGVCLTAFILELKYALAATFTYILLGAVGLPVFSHFSGGFGVLFGASGGFLWGFLASVLLCGFAKKATSKAARYTLTVLAVVACHTAGVIQYSVVTGNGLLISFFTASLPFLLKDIFLAFAASFVSSKIKI